MSLVLDAMVLWATSGAGEAQAEALCQRLRIARVATVPQAGPYLCLHEQRLEFRMAGNAELPGALWVDFDGEEARRRSRQPSGELLVRAAKIRQLAEPLLIDATAGLGRDGFLLACQGFRVCMIEANPVIAALLADGLARAGQLPHLQTAVSRLELRVGDAVNGLNNLAEHPAVVYLDPMFPERSKTAKVKQNLRLLRLLEGKVSAPEPLLQAALATGARKVVVKRPLKGPFLADLAPSYTLKGKAVRFDVYVGATKKNPLATPDQPGAPGEKAGLR